MQKHRSSRFGKFSALSCVLLTFGFYLTYLTRIRVANNTVKGTWSFVDFGRYGGPRSNCKISFYDGGITQTECRSGSATSIPEKYKTQSSYQVKLNRIEFFNTRMIEMNPVLDLFYWNPVPRMSLEIKDKDNIVVRWPLEKAMSNFDSGPHINDEAIRKWKRIS